MTEWMRWAFRVATHHVNFDELNAEEEEALRTRLIYPLVPGARKATPTVRVESLLDIPTKQGKKKKKKKKLPSPATDPQLWESILYFDLSPQSHIWQTYIRPPEVRYKWEDRFYKFSSAYDKYVYLSVASQLTIGVALPFTHTASATILISYWKQRAFRATAVHPLVVMAVAGGAAAYYSQRNLEEEVRESSRERRPQSLGEELTLYDIIGGMGIAPRL